MLCILTGALYAALLYFRESRFKDQPLLHKSLTALRFVVVTILAMLLLEPMLRYFDKEIEPPIVVIAADNSQSMVMGKDSLELRATLSQMLESLEGSFGSDYEVATYSFGQNVKEGLALDFSDPVTDLSMLLSEVQNRYANRNIGAVILATDGIHNRGANPRYTLGASNFKVLPLALGDTMVQRDALIAEVAANRIAYLGNKFPIEVMLEARKLSGRVMNFSVLHKGKSIHNESIEVNDEAFRKPIRLLLDATEPGTQRYTLRIAPLEGELTLANNTREVFVDVIDSRQKVLIVAASPHPDIAALRNAITSNENYQAEVQLIGNFNASLDAYDLVVLHQIPVVHPRSEELRLALLKSDKPIFAILGTQSVLNTLPQYGLGLDIGGWRGSYHDVGATVADGFSSFKLDAELNAFMRDAPPLKVAFGNWRKANSADVLLYQRVGSIRTDDPLLIVNKTSSRKVAVMLGEGIWRWRLYDYATTQNHKRFDTFIGSLVQFLALKTDKRLFRINHDLSFMENERIVFGAELYNDAYEPVNDSEVNILFTDEEGREYPFVFSRTSSAYRLDAGSLPVGNYNYTASTSRGGARLAESGQITVKPYALEGASLTANHNLLYALAEASNGKVFYPSESGEIKNYLDQTAQLKPVSYTTEVFDSILNLKWLFVLILALLSAEWFMRKRSGNY